MKKNQEHVLLKDSPDIFDIPRHLVLYGWDNRQMISNGWIS